MVQPLMPKATAVWLVDNTTLTFEQIADFCEMHVLEVQAVADGEVATGIVGLDPVAGGQITQDDLDRCCADSTGRLTMVKQRELPPVKGRKTRYTPVSKRGDKPDAIAWLARNHPEITNAQISKLIGTTKQTIVAVRERSHWNSSNIKPRDPVLLGLCSQIDLNGILDKAVAAASKGKPGTAPTPAPVPVSGLVRAPAPPTEPTEPVPVFADTPVREPEPEPVAPTAESVFGAKRPAKPEDVGA